MLAGAILCILLPLSRRQQTAAHEVDSIDVYKQQLAELEAMGKPSDATATERAEIARRILRSKRQGKRSQNGNSSNSSGSKWASVASIVVLPILAIGTYFYTGSPYIPDQPLSAAKSEKLEDKSIEEMVLIAERHLAKNPNDQKGWEVLAGVYGRLDRAGDKARALQELIRLAGPSPDRLADLGEALTVAGGNIVPSRAREMFEQALATNPAQTKASFYLAIAFEQEGKFQAAYDRYKKLINLQKSNPQWQKLVGTRIATVRSKLGLPVTDTSKLSGPTNQDVQDASALSNAERRTMIEGMVASLASKLSEEPNDLAGWLRLIRSYVVLEKPKKANDALVSARKQFKSVPDSLAEINSLAAGLNLKELEIKQ